VIVDTSVIVAVLLEDFSQTDSAFAI